jgi:serine phosphatase RsbU (regulator of sigma subunit)
VSNDKKDFDTFDIIREIEKNSGLIYKLQTTKLLPKLVYDKISQMKLNHKIYLIIFISVIPILMVTLVSISLLAGRIQDDIKNRITESGKAAKNTINYFLEQTHAYSKMIAENQLVKHGLTFEKEQFKIRDYIGTLIKDLDVDLTYIHDVNMKVIAQGSNTARFNIDHSNDILWKPILKNAQKGRRVWNIYIKPGDKENSEDGMGLIMITTVPIFHATEKKYVIGFSTVGYRLDNFFAKKVKEIIGNNIIFTYTNNESGETKLVASSFYDPARPGRNARLNNEKNEYVFDSSPTMNILGISYDRGYIPIIYDEKMLSSSSLSSKIWTFVDNSDLKNSLYMTIGGITVFFILIITMVLLVAFKIAYNIIDSIERILIGTQHISNKNFGYKIHLNSDDELAHLANTFNEMTGAIKDYSENLENKVKERTKALQEANIKLEVTNEELAIINNEINKELQVAKSLQDALLPTNIPDFKNIQIGTAYISMGTVGGDYYDVFNISDDELGILMADASGHGVPAALITTMAKVTFTAQSIPNISTGEICSRVNRDMFKSLCEVDNYITAFYGIVNGKTNEFQFTNAGHQKAIYYNSAEAQIEELDTNGFFIGAIEEALYETKKIKLSVGDRIILFTDGITEARNEDNEFFGNERLLEYFLDHLDDSTDDFINNFILYLNRFCGRRKQDDDISLLIVSAAETEEGENTFKKEHLLKENYETMLFSLESGLTYLDEEKYNEALEVFNKIVKFKPDDFQAIYNIGLVYFKKKEYREARQHWEKALQLQPDSSTLWKDLETVDNLIRKVK